MKLMSSGKIAIAIPAFACATLLSFGWTEQRGVSLSVESAQARVGRPLTPVSVAGVARRQARRAGYGYGGYGGYGYGGYGYGAAAVGAGLAAAAIGTAAVAATSPWGYYGNGYSGDAYSSNAYYGSDYGGGYHAASPWGDYECQPGHAYECRPHAAKDWGYPHY